MNRKNTEIISIVNSILILSLGILYSCNGKHVEKIEYSKNLEVIKVPEVPSEEVDFSDFFSSFKMVPLETGPNSVIGNIRRISVYKSNYYILDRQTNSVFIFNSEGKFLNKIHNIGQGEGKYTGLMDFTIDEKKDHIILYTHRPYKLLYFDTKGNYLEEERMSDLYRSVTLSGRDLLFVNAEVKKGYMIYSKNLDTHEERYIMPMLNHSGVYEYFAWGNPSMLKGMNTNISFPYVDTLYEAKDGIIKAKYHIDFGKKKLPDYVYKRRTPTSDIVKLAIDKDYGFGIANFVELKDMVYFTYASGISVFYSKKDKKVVSFRRMINKDNSLEVRNIFAHDGNDSVFTSLYSASSFLNFMEILKIRNKFDRLPADIKQMASATSENSNPIIFVCTLKGK